MHVSVALLSALLAVTGSAHPGHASKEFAARREFLKTNANNINHCTEQHRISGLQERSIKRRSEIADKLIQERGLDRRQLSTIGTSHKSDKAYNASTDTSVVFGGNRSCVLSPEVTEGPFYVLGQYVRTKLVDGEVGVPLHVDVQVIDVTTCQPAQGVYLELWGVNSTGVYSGALAIPNGSGMGDKANLNKSFLRGLQPTDKDGAVQFESIFPGHYAGRTTHMHITTHLDAKVEANNTVWGTKVTHAGQVFFDQTLIDQVEKTTPYSTNRQTGTKNTADNILRQEAVSSDPFFEYVMLGKDLQDGIFAWMTVGVNTTLYREIMWVAMNGKGGGSMATGNPSLGGLFPGGFPGDEPMKPVPSKAPSATHVLEE